jgi:hypothetical protein
VSYQVEALRRLECALGAGVDGFHAGMGEHLTVEKVIKTRDNRFGNQRRQVRNATFCRNCPYVADALRRHEGRRKRLPMPAFG